MILQLAKDVGDLLFDITGAEYSKRSHQVEYVAKYYDESGKMKDVVCTVQLKHYIPRDVYGEPGFFYEKERIRRVRNKDRKWVDIRETVRYYELSEADKKFIYVSYVYHHLNQRQISKLSEIPQPYVYRYIKHMKLKPKYDQMTKKERNIDALAYLRDELGLNRNVSIDSDEFGNNEASNVEIDDSIDFEKPFHVDPYPTRSEWKVRREQLGLKNAEDWRNHNDADGEITAKEYGDGSTVRRRKAAKAKRKEKRKIKNIQKYNLHQNNRYGMTIENPEGDRSKRKFPDQVIPRKEYIGNGGTKGEKLDK